MDVQLCGSNDVCNLCRYSQLAHLLSKHDIGIHTQSFLTYSKSHTPASARGEEALAPQ